MTPSGMIQVTLITIGFFRDLIVIDSQEGLLNTNLGCPFVGVSEMKQEVSMRDNGRYYHYRDIVNELQHPMFMISFPRFY